MSKLLIALFTMAGMTLAGSAVAQVVAPKSITVAMSKDSYVLAKKDADAQLKIDENACSSLSGNAKDVCMAEATGKASVAKADAEAAYENTTKARQNARLALADANYKVAIEKCDDLAGNPKDVCAKEAKASLVKAKADAKVDRVTADARHDSAAKQSEVVKEATADKRDAEYKVAIEKCDALAGASKDSCVANAKVQFGKS